MSKLFGSERASKPHLVRGSGGIPGEIADLRADIDSTFDRLEDGGGYLVTEEFTNVATADVNAIVVSMASSNAIVALAAEDLDGVVGNDEMVPPRNVTVTTSTHADIDAVAVVVTGRVRNSDGKLVAQTDTITLTNGGGATDLGDAMFSIVDSVTIPAQGGSGGAVEVGFGALIGLGKAMKSRAGLRAPIRQIAIGAVVTTGTFSAPATNLPHGAYAPAAAPNGTNDYAITYEVDTSF